MRDPVDRRDRLALVNTVLAARRYFLDGATKSEIANELGLSRFKVARLLDDALRDGIVRIEIDPVPEIDEVLSRELAVTHGLRSAVVVRTVDGPGEFQRSQLGRAAASVLADSLDDDDVLGISWGRTLHSMIGHLPQLPGCAVVQIVGIVPSLELNVNSLELVRRLAARAGGPVYPLPVPLIVEDAAVATALRGDANIARTMSMFPKLTRALVGIGAWDAGRLDPARVTVRRRCGDRGRGRRRRRLLFGAPRRRRRRGPGGWHPGALHRHQRRRAAAGTRTSSPCRPAGARSRRSARPCAVGSSIASSRPRTPHVRCSARATTHPAPAERRSP